MSAGARSGVDALSAQQIVHGDGPPEPPAIELSVGPLSASLQGVELAYVRYGDREVVRRIYMSVRDENWDTILPDVGDLDIQQLPDRVLVTFSARNESGSIAIAWNGRIELGADGSVSYDMNAAAERSFRYCRVGFCILHDADSHAGRPYRASAAGFPPSSGTLPERIAAQYFRGGIYLPVVPVYTDFEIDLDGGLGVRFELSGELFELEDQRNWTDASFKTYCTPADKRYPFDAALGQRFSQRVSVSLSGPRPGARRLSPRTVEIDFGEPLGLAPPRIGIGLGATPAPLSEREAAALAALAPSHLRADVHLGRADAPAAIDAAAAAALAVGVPLELALFSSAQDSGRMAAMLAPLRRRAVAVARVLAFDEELDVTPSTLPQAVRRALRDAGIDAPTGGGTDIWFAEIHRDPPQASALEVLSFSLTPEVHAFDDVSLIETLAVQALVTRAAGELAPGLPVAVSPVTLRPRNSATTIDARQRSLFCAAWTVGTIRYLSEGGAATATFYEALGARGIMESDAGSPAHDGYPALAGVVFPVYHVLAHAGSLASGALCPISSSDPARADAYAIATPRATHIAIANMRATPELVRLAVATHSTSARVLDARSAAAAMASPGSFVQRSQKLRCVQGAIELELGPHAVAFVEIAREHPE